MAYMNSGYDAFNRGFQSALAQYTPPAVTADMIQPGGGVFSRVLSSLPATVTRTYVSTTPSTALTGDYLSQFIKAQNAVTSAESTLADLQNSRYENMGNVKVMMSSRSREKKIADAQNTLANAQNNLASLQRQIPSQSVTRTITTSGVPDWVRGAASAEQGTFGIARQQAQQGLSQEANRYNTIANAISSLGV